MKDLALLVSVLVAAYFCFEWRNQKLRAEDAAATIELIERMYDLEMKGVNDAAELKKGGSDEPLSDYGRNAAGILWGEAKPKP